MDKLWSLWDKYFPHRPAHNNRGYVEGRVAYKLQQEAYGCASTAHSQMIRIGEAVSKIKARKAIEVHVVPGTVLVREYADREHHVTALADGNFAYDGRQFKSLSAAARYITGSQWSGPLFFGLRNQRSTK
jgi:hypothetical protein